MKKLLNRWSGWLGILAALLCCFLLVGAGIDGQLSSDFSLESSQSESENPFEGAADMRVYREALEIIGSTSLDDLSDAQKVQLAALGIPEEQLPEFLSNLEIYLSQSNESTEGYEPVNSWWDTGWIGFVIMVPVLLAVVIFLLIWFGKRNHPRGS